MRPGGAAPAFDQAALGTAVPVPVTPPVWGPNVAAVTSSALQRAAHQYGSPRLPLWGFEVRGTGYALVRVAAPVWHK
jgi:hypothetical protein